MLLTIIHKEKKIWICGTLLSRAMESFVGMIMIGEMVELADSRTYQQPVTTTQTYSTYQQPVATTTQQVTSAYVSQPQQQQSQIVNTTVNMGK